MRGREQQVCTKHGQPINHVCTMQTCANRKICESCRSHEALHFQHHNRYIFSMIEFDKYYQSKDLIPRTESSIAESEKAIGDHKKFYAEQINKVRADFDLLVNQFKEMSEHYKQMYINIIGKEMTLYDEEFAEIKTTLRQYTTEKNEQESFFSRLFSSQTEKEKVDDIVKKHMKIFKTRAAVINLRSKISKDYKNRTKYKGNQKTVAAFEELRDYLKTITNNLYEKFQDLLMNEDNVSSASTLRQSIVSQSRSLAGSQVSQSSISFVGKNLAVSDVTPSNGRNSGSFETNLAMSQCSPAKRQKVKVFDPHPEVLKIISILKPIEYSPNLPMISNMGNRREEGPYKHQNGIYYGTYDDLGNRSGKGKFIFSRDGSYYEGSWDRDTMYGYGRLITQSTFYEGQVKNGVAHGTGTFETSQKVYCGEWKNDKRHGKGQQRYKRFHIIYKGMFANDKYQGYGSLEQDDYTYIGMFSEGLFDGQGKIKYKNGETFQGIFKAGNRISGVHIMIDGSYYDGQYLNNVPHGFGQFRWPDGVKYRGGWRNGAMSGEGTQIIQNVREAKGIWKDGIWQRWI